VAVVPARAVVKTVVVVQVRVAAVAVAVATVAVVLVVAVVSADQAVADNAPSIKNLSIISSF
jgi:hypothetical protein